MNSSRKLSSHWQDVAAAFEWDGGLLDIYVFKATHEDWQKLWDLLLCEPDRLVYRCDLIATQPPRDVARVFAARDVHTIDLSYSLGRMTLRCHFFIEDEIELDLDPREVDEKHAAKLEQFMIAVGTSLVKDVVLTAENARDAVIARYAAAGARFSWAEWN